MKTSNCAHLVSEKFSWISAVTDREPCSHPEGADAHDGVWNLVNRRGGLGKRAEVTAEDFPGFRETNQLGGDPCGVASLDIIDACPRNGGDERTKEQG
jgi:hypothetical protein